MMEKQTQTTVRGNVAKYDRYRQAHERLNLAVKHGFYIEGAMLCESLMADRLHSHLHWRVYEAELHASSFFGKAAPCISYGPGAVVEGKAAFVPFGVLVGMYAKCIHHDHAHEHASAPRWVSAKRTVSPAILKYWADERNKVAHGAVKTHPTRKAYDETFLGFQERAARCTANGVDLVRLIANWDASVRRAQRVS